MSSSMKFIRWLLSHLAMIFVLSLILYLYWNRNELWSYKEVESAQVASDQSTHQVSQEQKVQANITHEPERKIVQQGISRQSSDQKVEVLKKAETLRYPSDIEQVDTSIMSEQSVKNEKRFEKHAIIEVKVEEPLLYPSDIENEIITTSIEATKPQLDARIDAHPKTSTGENSETVDLATESFEAESFEAESLEVKNLEVKNLEKAAKVVGNVENGSDNQDSDDHDKGMQATDSINDSSNQSEVVSYTDRSIQQQIRDRQKQLSNQMISLISITMNKTVEYETVDTTSNVEPIEPVIETAEQKNLLQDARKAFDEHNFKLAEEKYLQLMQQLPELPDVVGELANVYKSQKRESDYIAMNTQFVKRLAEHYRFDEAWRVVSETNKVDLQSANKQRRIIYKKQKESQH